MITESSMYWILKLDDFCTLFKVFVFLTGIFSVVVAISSAVKAANVYDDDDRKFVETTKKYFFRSAILTIILALIIALLPSTKQMAMIKVLPKIANSEIVGEMSADAKEIYRMGIKAIKESLGGAETALKNEAEEKNE